MQIGEARQLERINGRRERLSNGSRGDLRWAERWRRRVLGEWLMLRPDCKSKNKAALGQDPDQDQESEPGPEASARVRTGARTGSGRIGWIKCSCSGAGDGRATEARRGAAVPRW